MLQKIGDVIKDNDAILYISSYAKVETIKDLL